ncbi:MAG: hypothetical protein K8R60_02235 [Burkholderiales bacterium]|nr:hypothetical protein [Burkholderiales bacterium]
MTTEAQGLALLARARQALRDGFEGEALALARQAAESFPDSLVVRVTLGFALSASGLHDEAERVFEQARAHDPAAVRAYCARLGALPHEPLLLDARAIHLAHDFARRRACDWRSADYLQRFAEWIESAPSQAARGERLERGLTFHALALGLPLPLLQRVNRAVTDSIRRQLDPPTPPPEAPRSDGPLRLGYLSHNFGQHPTAYLTQDLYALHDRSRFSVHGFALDADDGGPLRKKIAGACDHWVDAHGLHPREVAQCIREHGIDVLVAMGGYQTGPVIDVCLYRPAPVQVNYLAFQATLGCPEVAFHVTDRHCTLPHEAACWDEALVRLGDTHFVYPYRQAIGPRPPRAEEGLPDDALVLCGFNNGYKIEPGVFAVWCELLRRLPHAVLWIYQSHPQQGGNLRRSLAGAGIEPERLVVSRFESDPARHLARLALADLFVDTFTYSAHTTMLDALYAGVPPVSLAGTTTVGRLGASFVRAAGLPENVCADREAYVQRVLQLAGDAAERERQRQHLRHCREQEQGPFDVPRRTRELEAAYGEMWRQHRAGVAPRGFDVDAAGVAATHGQSRSTTDP